MRFPARAAAAGTGLVSAMMCPSSISMRRRVRAATAWSWVMMTTVVPAALSSSSRARMDGAGGRVQVAGGLVGQHHRRRARDGPRDRDPLPLAARQLGRPGGGLVRQPDPVQRGRGQPPPLVAADPGVQQPVGDVAQHALVLGEEELLEHEPDPRRPQRGQLPVGHPRHVQAGDPDGPGGRLVQGAHQVQQRGLARPRRADHRRQLPGRHRQAHLIQRPHRRLPRVHLRHLLQLQHRHRPPAAVRRAAGAPPAAAVTTPPPRRAGRAASAPVTCTRPEASSKIPGRHRHPAPRVPRGPTTSTSYRPEDWASSAVTGTASTSCTAGGGDVHRHRRLVQGPRRPRVGQRHLHRDRRGRPARPGRGRHRADRGHHARRGRPVRQRDGHRVARLHLRLLRGGQRDRHHVPVRGRRSAPARPPGRPGSRSPG